VAVGKGPGMLPEGDRRGLINPPWSVHPYLPYLEERIWHGLPQGGDSWFSFPRSPAYGCFAHGNDRRRHYGHQADLGSQDDPDDPQVFLPLAGPLADSRGRVGQGPHLATDPTAQFTSQLGGSPTSEPEATATTAW